MAGLGSKTPVSCLQEYLISKKMIPQYELVFNGVGTHAPKFTFRVQVGALCEEGTGRSKQEAKHRAAEKMLKSLEVINDDDKTGEKQIDLCDYTKESNENYVGQLKDFCILQRYPEPKYYLEEAAGPSHSRIFKMICCVSQLRDFGISKTKKQAKHQAAFKMLQRLKEVGSNRAEEGLSLPDSSTRVPHKCSASITDEDIIEKYATLKPSTNVVCKNPVAYYKDHHMAYVGLHETSLTLAKLLNETEKADYDNSLHLIEEIAKELEVTTNITEISTKEKDVNYIVILMTVFPPIAAAGDNIKNAAFNLLNSLLMLCKE